MGKIELKQAGTLNHYGNDQMNRVYATDGLAPTITVKSGGGREPKIKVLGNYSPSGHEATRVISPDGISPTIKQNHGSVTAVQIKSANGGGCELARQGDSINLAYP
ncbi:MAG: hypothetical protein KBS59_00270 [Clostridiales bacterium]|nr:hypothetical protein [Clostridiales bacterium]